MTAHDENPHEMTHQSTHQSTHHEASLLPPDHLLQGFTAAANRPPDTLVRSGRARPARRRPSGGGFGDPTPGVDRQGLPMACSGCGVGLSQPRIDYGLNTCPRCRPTSQPSPAAAVSAPTSGVRP